ncbi:hypothetical protein GQ607_009447 [Colletotrichum asianum]|uniref:Uncharacterized protein n=1 Tax=Colletotrichum asianum TaxID=702518 RepID=A0A8H3WA77_9PEZI|nr:hypothetical protein GQ607_009447 [Colletotrichum asianum]
MQPMLTSRLPMSLEVRLRRTRSSRTACLGTSGQACHGTTLTQCPHQEMRR